MRLIFSILLMITLSSQAETSAYEIMKKVDDRYVGDTTVSTQTMFIVNSRGNKLVRKIKSFSKIQGDTTKSVISLLQPADVKDIAFLSHQWEQLDKDTQTWMFLPALDRVERMPESDRSNAFMGSDFSFSDMDGLEIELWQYRFISQDEQLDGEKVYTIEATPKPQYVKRVKDETGYSRVELWVSKDSYIVLRSKHYVANSSKMKELTVEDIRKIENIYTFKLTMKTYKGKRLENASILMINDIEYNTELADSMFTPGQLRQ